MNKISQLNASDLINYWKKGWPDYVLRPADDYPAIWSIYQQCADAARVDATDQKYYERLTAGLVAMANYCQNTDPWDKKNLHFINRATQSVLQEMNAIKRANKRAKELSFMNDQYRIDQLKVTENERLLQECRDNCKKWHEENFTEEMEQEYQAWLVSRGIKKVPIEMPALIGDVIKNS